MGREGWANIYLPPASVPAVDDGMRKDGMGRRRSSVLVAEIEAIRRLARRVGDAARRGSASSFRRGDVARRGSNSSFRRERDRDRGRERDRDRERDDGRGGEKVVDEEARRLALRNGEVVRSLVHEREVKIEAERLVERERERGRLGASGGGNGLSFLGGSGGGGAYQDSPYRQAQWAGSNGGGGSLNGRGGSFEVPPQGNNHIHVHTAPLIQGPSISTPPATAMGGYAAAGMGAGEQFVGYGVGGGMGKGMGMGGLGLGSLGMGLGAIGGMGIGSERGMGRGWEREREIGRAHV